jgi:TRAP-type transport system periplasmic protein
MMSHCAHKSDDVYIIKVSLWANQSHTWYAAFNHFKKILHQRTDGRIEVQVYPSEQLAKEIESIRLIQAGVIDMTVTASLLSNWIEIAAFCEMPFLLRNQADKEYLINGPLGAQIKQEILEKTGLRVVGLFERGQRQLTSNRPIKHPDELNGMILRVPSVPTFVTAWSAMGAKPTPMAFSEVFTSLQQGTIEGQENPLELILSSGFSEVQKYVNRTNHVMSWSYPVIGEAQFQKLPKDLQGIFLNAAIEMENYERELFLNNQNEVEKQLKDNGMQFIEVDNDAFSRKCASAIYESLSPNMKTVYQEFMKNRPDIKESQNLE